MEDAAVKSKKPERKAEKIARDGRKMNARSLQNLKPPFSADDPKPGPGRPPGKLNKDTMIDLALEGYCRKLLAEYNKKRKRKITIEQLNADPELDIFMRLIDKARGGDMRAIDSFLDRRYGKPTQAIELSGPGGNPIEYDVQLKAARERIKKFQDQWFEKPLQVKAKVI